ncbi:MAG TPA: glycoside hydrolase family 28 protein [Candidatus Sulfopaludibacter sp.]|jgi:polygalacturonase|nr:glycoside hydrolase family 28 protein [Candidatus Sulfopaludibacter sp.]
MNIRRRDLLAIAVAAAPLGRAATHSFDVRDSGAKGDGKTKDTAAIQKAVDACAQAGGGIVYVSPGTYLSGTIVLKSNVTFHLEAGATLLGSTDLADYRLEPGPPATGDANGKHLLFARDAENVTVSGSGRIDGQGRAFWLPANRVAPKPEDLWRDVATYDWKPTDRPSPMVEFFNCRNLRIEDVTLANSSGWTLRPIECDTVVIRGIKIRNPVIGPNTDGIDPTCCRNVFISDCDIATGDDCICLKSEGPYGRMGLTRNITITNCVLTSCCNGLKFGTATRGGFENISFSNSVIHNDDVPLNARVIAGIALEMVDGGWVDGVVISNIRMQRVRTPIFIRLGARNGNGRLRGVMIENVHATGAILTSSITGIPGHDVEDVTLSGIRIDTEEAGKAAWMSAPVPEQIKSYPEARMFGRLPAYGLYCRHVDGLKLEDLTIHARQPDERPALHFEDVKNLRIDRPDVSKPSTTQPPIRLIDVQGAVVTGCDAAGVSQEGKSAHIAVQKD